MIDFDVYWYQAYEKKKKTWNFFGEKFMLMRLQIAVGNDIESINSDFLFVSWSFCFTEIVNYPMPDCSRCTPTPKCTP